MAKYIDADHLKVEIEKHIKEVKDAAKRFTPNIGFFDAKLSGIYDVIAIIDSLQQKQPEKPMNLDFEQELYNRFGMVKDFTLGMRIAQAFYDLGCRRTAEKYDEIEYNRQRAEESEKPMNLEEEINRYLREECSDDDEPGIHEIAEHFAKWGAEHLASTGKTSPKDLEEAADNHIRKVVDAAGHPGWDWTTQDIADAFIAGAKLQKEQMMEEAVEGEVIIYDGLWQIHAPNLDTFLRKMDEGDKVKIIIVKEDEV